MAGMNTLQTIKMIPKYDRNIFIEWARYFNDVLQLSWLFLSKIISGFENQIQSSEGVKKEK